LNKMQVRTKLPALGKLVSNCRGKKRRGENLLRSDKREKTGCTVPEGPGTGQGGKKKETGWKKGKNDG